MLQATRGIVSGSRSFFMRAYGEDRRAFERLLSLPHAFIFHRDYFEYGKGRDMLDEYNALRRRFSDSQERELIHLLSGPAEAKGLRRDNYQRLENDARVDPLIRKAMPFHMLDIHDKPKAEGGQVLSLFSQLNPDPVMPEEDEIVEDAGLFDHEQALEQDDNRRVKTAN